MIELPADFIARMRGELKQEYPEFSATYALPPVRGVRVNTLKISPEEFEKLSPVPLDGGVPWERRGFYSTGEGLGKSVLHFAGAYYVQEPSAMCAVPELDIRRGERVLDLCSAPGGKGTQIAQYMQGEGVLVLNEYVRSRVDILRSNVERLGVKNAVVTCADPSALAGVFAGYFDKILVDAPCSGEGMFKKEQSAIPEWSLKNVELCAQRQRGILDSASKMLCGGGRLVYSTCTFAPEEDELQIADFLKNHADFELLSQKKLYPHRVRGEGHFCAVLQKRGGERADLPTLRLGVADKTLLKLYREWERETLKIKLDNIYERGKRLYLIADGAPDLSLTNVPHGAGVCLGGLSKDGKRFEPFHALAMSLKFGEVNCIEVDGKTALGYMRGLTFECDRPNGWHAVTYKNLPLGWCKVAGGTAKNHLPKGIRI